MSLKSVAGVIEEQGRIYRLSINGHIRPSDMCRYMFGLREIRTSIESLPPAGMSPEAPTINIVTVPHNHFVTENDIRQTNGLPPIDPQLVIEHDPSPALRELEAEVALAAAHNREPESEAQTDDLRELSDLVRRMADLVSSQA